MRYFILIYLLISFTTDAQQYLTRNEMLRNGISTTEYGLNVQRGKVPGVSVIHKFGRNDDIDTASGFEVIWDGDGPYTGFNATAAETLEIFSDSAADVNTLGTGAHLVEIRGLGPGYVRQVEIVALNGVTPVNTANTYIRMEDALVLTAGTTGANEGTLTIRQNVTVVNVMGFINPLSNRTLMATYTVPFGKVAYVTSGFASMAKKQNSFNNIRALVRFPGSVFQVAEFFTISSSGSSYVFRNFKVPLIGIAAGTDITIDGDSSVNDVGVAGGFEVLIVDVDAP